MAGRIEQLGAWARGVPEGVGRAANLLVDCLYSARSLAQAGPRDAILRVLGGQVWYTGVEAAPLVGAMGVAVGLVLVSLGWGSLHDLGAEDAFGELVRVLVLGELAPLLTALVVVARSGVAITTELATMRIQDEIDALVVHGVDPYAWLGLPRLVGVAASTVSLTVLMSAAVGLGCLVVAVPMQAPAPMMLELVLEAVRPADVGQLLAKSLLFGLAIPVVTLLRGLRGGRDPSEVPRAGSRAVVDALILIFGLDAVLVLVFRG